MRQSGIFTVESARFPCSWRARRSRSTAWKSSRRQSMMHARMQCATASTMRNFMSEKRRKMLPHLYETEGIFADVIVVDPPRKGCDEECLNTILKMRPKRLVYVSCDSATLARDLKYLCSQGYELKYGRAFDNFPMGGTCGDGCLAFQGRGRLEKRFGLSSLWKIWICPNFRMGQPTPRSKTMCWSIAG